YRGKTNKPHGQAARAVPASADTPGSALWRNLPQAMQLHEAAERMVLPMVNEAAACLSEGLAADAATIDFAMVLGIGWAPHRGGPLRYGQERGLANVVQTLQELA